MLGKKERRLQHDLEIGKKSLVRPYTVAQRNGKNRPRATFPTSTKGKCSEGPSAISPQKKAGPTYGRKNKVV